MPSRTATPAVPPVAAEDLDIPAAGYEPEPDSDAGVPVLDGLTVVGRSAARNADVEAVDVVEPDLLQVSSYHAATSTKPYVLHSARRRPAAAAGVPAYTRTGGAVGAMPDLAALPEDLQTIVLVNRQRMGDAFGPQAADDVLAALDELVARDDVKGVVVPVDADPAIAAAYREWDANPCVATAPTRS